MEAHVTIKKFCADSGMTENAVRALIKKGQWRLNTHFVKSPNGRVFIKIREAIRWQEGIPA